MGPLHGIKVLDLSRILAGPWATQCLADFGATVWKVEKPGAGDDTRHWGPPWMKDAGGRDTGEAAYYLSSNRGKYSLAIDFTRAAGQKLIRGLAQRADVLIENFRVGTLARYGLGYKDLGALNQRLIYCSISAFGQDGPEAGGAGYDAMIQGMSGLMSVTGVPDGEPGAGPIKVGVAVSDLISGMYALSAVLGALYEREQSGQGQAIDLALLDAQIAALANQGLNYLVSGLPPGRRGTAHPNIVPYQAFATADGYLMLAIGNDRQFASFCTVAGRPELAADERFRANAGRVSNRAALPEVVGDAGLYSDPDDAESLTAALERLIGDAHLRTSLAQRGLDRASQFTWTGTARGVRRAWEDALLARRQRTPALAGAQPGVHSRNAHRH